MLFFITAIQNEDERRFVEQLYHQNYKLMMYIAQQILKDHDKAEDAVSQAFIKIIDKFEKFSFENCNKTRGLIGILVKDICYDMLKSEKHRDFISLEECDLPDNSDDIPFEALLSKDNYQALQDALTRLSEKSGSVLKLKYVYGYSDLEIAEFLNITHENVRVRLHRAKAALWKALKEGNIFDE